MGICIPKDKVLSSLPLFTGSSRREIARLCRLCTEVTFRPGDDLMVQGALGREVFVIVEGVAGVVRDGQQIAVLGAGSAVGEMALLGGVTRSATVTARTPITALVFSAGEFSTALRDSATMDRAVRASVAERAAA